MIKVSASISRKVPLPGVQYASHGYGGSIEIEVADSADPSEVKRRLHELYRVLHAAVAEEIAAAAQGKPHVAEAPKHGNGNGNGNGSHPSLQMQPRTAAKRFPATIAQQRAVMALTKANGIAVADALKPYAVQTVESLSIRQASELIDKLKATQSRAGGA